MDTESDALGRLSRDLRALVVAALADPALIDTYHVLEATNEGPRTIYHGPDHAEAIRLYRSVEFAIFHRRRGSLLVKSFHSWPDPPARPDDTEILVAEGDGTTWSEERSATLAELLSANEDDPETCAALRRLRGGSEDTVLAVGFVGVVFRFRTRRCSHGSGCDRAAATGRHRCDQHESPRRNRSPRRPKSTPEDKA